MQPLLGQLKPQFSPGAGCGDSQSSLFLHSFANYFSLAASPLASLVAIERFASRMANISPWLTYFICPSVLGRLICCCIALFRVILLLAMARWSVAIRLRYEIYSIPYWNFGIMRFVPFGGFGWFFWSVSVNFGGEFSRRGDERFATSNSVCNL